MWGFLALLALFIVLVTYTVGALSAAPWVPARKKDIARFIKLAKIKTDERVYDLGCGDGRVLEAAARAGARATGFEISLFPYFLARLRARNLPNNQMRVLYKNFWRADLRDADVVYVFLMTKIFKKLTTKLIKELRPGTRVISYVFKIPGWEPVATDKIKNNVSLYLYIVPTNPAPQSERNTPA